MADPTISFMLFNQSAYRNPGECQVAAAFAVDVNAIGKMRKPGTLQPLLEGFEQPGPSPGTGSDHFTAARRH